jgi:hypothetical protein
MKPISWLEDSVATDGAVDGAVVSSAIATRAERPNRAHANKQPIDFTMPPPFLISRNLPRLPARCGQFAYTLILYIGNGRNRRQRKVPQWNRAASGPELGQ